MAGAVAIGGVFFRCNDLDAMSAWYATHLGVITGAVHWQQRAGPLVFAPFPAKSDYFSAIRQWMVNFRVDDLTELCAALGIAGIEVETHLECHDEWARFARIHDPEGNPAELWEAQVA